MSRKLDVPEGTRFGKLTVLHEVDAINGARVFLCRCECGNEKRIRLTALIRGATKSCRECNIIKVEPGQIYGDWEVLSIKPSVRRNGRKVAVCKCKCGNVREVAILKLVGGLTLSCGCWRSGAKEHKRLYVVWQGMLSRCYNPNDPKYPDYGGRGIVVCDEWLGGKGFLVSWNGHIHTIMMKMRQPENAL